MFPEAHKCEDVTAYVEFRLFSDYTGHESKGTMWDVLPAPFEMVSLLVSFVVCGVVSWGQIRLRLICAWSSTNDVLTKT